MVKSGVHWASVYRGCNAVKLTLSAANFLPADTPFAALGSRLLSVSSNKLLNGVGFDMFAVLYITKPGLSLMREKMN